MRRRIQASAVRPLAGATCSVQEDIDVRDLGRRRRRAVPYRSNLTYVVIAAVIALVALGFAAALTKAVLAAGKGTKKMQEIAGAVQEGASAYLLRQFKTLGDLRRHRRRAALPAAGARHRRQRDCGQDRPLGSSSSSARLFSAFIGGAGMALATRANLRVAAAAREASGGRETAMQIAFRTGGVVGFLTVGLGLFGAALVVLIYQGDAPTVLEGFGFGAALLAMFMRVGGGIFTKAADVGADLVGKVEQGIPEDDPRNAATIADNVGDNVGDCAGMAADLFESYAVTLVAALILGRAAFGEEGLVFPLIVSTIGVLIAIVGVFITRLRPSDRNGLTAINRAFYISAVISAVLVAIAAFVYLPATFGRAVGRRRQPRRRRRPPRPARGRHRRGRHRHRAGRRHPGADRLLHRDQPAPGAGHRQERRRPARPPSSSPASASASSRPSTRRCSSAPASSARSCSAAARSRCRCSRWRWPAPACSPRSA